MSRLEETTAQLDYLDRKIELLQDLRSDLTDRLERLAHTWDERYPERTRGGGYHHWPRLGCTRCRFVYSGVREGHVVFGTGCTYCGENSGEGVKIPVEWFERALQKDDVTA